MMLLTLQYIEMHLSIKIPIVVPISQDYSSIFALIPNKSQEISFKKLNLLESALNLSDEIYLLITLQLRQRHSPSSVKQKNPFNSQDIVIPSKFNAIFSISSSITCSIY